MFREDVLRSFNDLDNLIYSTILKNGERIADMQVRDLAEEAHVSSASIVRFCKKVGCKGFSEFKYRYRDSLHAAQRPKPSYDAHRILSEFLSYSKTPAFEAAIAKSVELLQKARQILFFGVGESGNLAAFGARKFCSVGRFSLFIDDPFLPVANIGGEDTAAIAVSFSGTTEQTLKLAQRLSARGSKIICITNVSASPLAKLSDQVIAYHVADIPIGNHSNLGTQIPVVYVIERMSGLLYDAQKP